MKASGSGLRSLGLEGLGPRAFSLQPTRPKAQSPKPKACKIPPVPRVTVTIITKNEADHIDAAIDSASWADEIVVVDCDSTDDTVALARAKGVRVETRRLDRLGRSEELRGQPGLARLDLLARRRRARDARPGRRDQARARAATPTLAAYQVPRVTFHLGRWIRTTDFYPDFQTRLYDRRVARWRATTCTSR